MNAKAQLKKKLRLLLLTVLPLLLFVALHYNTRWCNDPQVLEAERMARRYAGWAGWGAKSCGSLFMSPFGAAPGPSPNEICGFAIENYHKRQPFSVVWQMEDLDCEHTQMVLMGTRTGRIFLAHFRSDGCGDDAEVTKLTVEDLKSPPSIEAQIKEFVGIEKPK